MADNIRLITYAEQTVTPMNDAILQDVEVGQNGILYGVEISASGNTISISGGYGVIKGRLFQVSSSNITVQLSSGSTLLGRLYISLDLSNQSEPISILTETGSTLSDLTQEDDANFTDGIYEMELARFSVSTTEVSNVQMVARTIHGGVKVITETDWSLDDVTDDGWYYFDHLHFPADHPGTLVNGWLRVLSGVISKKQILWREGSETTQVDTFVRSFTNGAWTSWKRFVSENEMCYMPGDQVTLYCYGAGFLTTGKQNVFFQFPLPKPIHSSVSGVSLVGSSNPVTIRQNGSYLADGTQMSTLSPSFIKRPNVLETVLYKSAGFGGTNNETVGILATATVQFN